MTYFILNDTLPFQPYSYYFVIKSTFFINFLHENKDKLINVTLSKEYEDIALDSSYQSQLVAICRSSATNGGSLKFGSKTATINGTTISLS